MSQEIIEAVREIERDKGIEEGALVSALEDALLAAYKKTPGASRHAEVKLDDAGEFRVFSIEIPSDIEARLLEEAREVARRAFGALGLEGLARVDMFVTADHRLIVNEVNTMPGFTPYSMFPVLWESMGLDYAELIADLIDQAASRRLGQR